ncbi:MAG: exosome complex RNA-binding protein Csl4 [Desulfurococcales archaeon]|nr:exosome complex RNA-binding protein Csl4 [Desulfurococcales archaeon]
MTSYYSRKNRLVVPGEPLASAEEYVNGGSTYIDDGLIRASTLGILRVDERSKLVNVQPFKKPKMPRSGSSVVGLVTSVRHDMVIVSMYGEIDLQPSPRWLYEYSSIYSGAIAISMVTKEYVDDINNYYRTGDIILARVLNNNTPYHLTTKPPQYGVIYALCSRCGGILQPVNPRTMKCPRCGYSESRKVSVLASSKLLRINIKNYLVVTKSW